MKWRLYYGNGDVYEGEGDADAFAAPCISAIILKQECDNPRGYSLRHGCAFFCWERIELSDGTILEEGRWGGKNDMIGLSHYWHTHLGPQKVLVGIEIHDETYHEISKIADNDGCFCTERCGHTIPRIGAR